MMLTKLWMNAVVIQGWLSYAALNRGRGLANKTGSGFWLLHAGALEKILQMKFEDCSYPRLALRPRSLGMRGARGSVASFRYHQAPQTCSWPTKGDCAYKDFSDWNLELAYFSTVKGGGGGGEKSPLVFWTLRHLEFTGSRNSKTQFSQYHSTLDSVFVNNHCLSRHICPFSKWLILPWEGLYQFIGNFITIN